MIDEEVRRIVDTCYRKAQDLLKANEEKLRKISARLMEKEVLDSEEVKDLAGMNGTVKDEAPGPPPSVTSSWPGPVPSSEEPAKG